MHINTMGIVKHLKQELACLLVTKVKAEHWCNQASANGFIDTNTVTKPQATKLTSQTARPSKNLYTEE